MPGLNLAPQNDSQACYQQVTTSPHVELTYGIVPLGPSSPEDVVLSVHGPADAIAAHRTQAHVPRI